MEIAHLECELPFTSVSKRVFVRNYSYERFGTKTCFETEAQGNSEMAHLDILHLLLLWLTLLAPQWSVNVNSHWMIMNISF